jgi:hypothetical protein
MTNTVNALRPFAQRVTLAFPTRELQRFDIGALSVPWTSKKRCKKCRQDQHARWDKCFVSDEIESRDRDVEGPNRERHERCKGQLLQICYALKPSEIEPTRENQQTKKGNKVVQVGRIQRN